MSIVDHQGKPIGYGWNDIAASEAVGRNPTLRLISDEEFETRFPEIARATTTAEKRAQGESVSSAQ